METIKVRNKKGEEIFYPFKKLFKIPEHEYHDIDLPSSSTLRTMINYTISHYYEWHVKDNEQEEEKSRDLFVGKLFHEVVLEGKKDWVVMPDFGDMRSAKNREKRDEFLLENTGKNVITVEEEEMIERMIESWNKLELNTKEMEIERSLIAELEGVVVKCRIDAIDNAKKIIYDVKTISDYSGIKRAIYGNGYLLQAALYYEALKSVSNDYVLYDFNFIFIEKERPNTRTIVKLQPKTLSSACNELINILREYKESLIIGSDKTFFLEI